MDSLQSPEEFQWKSCAGIPVRISGGIPAWVFAGNHWKTSGIITGGISGNIITKKKNLSIPWKQYGGICIKTLGVIPEGYFGEILGRILAQLL